MWALTKLCLYVYGRVGFTAYSDSSALVWLKSKKDVKVKLGWWIMALEEFDFSARKGNK